MQLPALPAQLITVLPSHHDGWDHGWGDGWWVVMAIGMLIFWAALIAGAVWLVRELSARRPRPGAEPTAFEILDRRLAEGEISSDEYAQRRRTLREAQREAPDGEG